jgi:hypothetical protein
MIELTHLGVGYAKSYTNNASSLRRNTKQKKGNTLKALKHRITYTQFANGSKKILSISAKKLATG